MRIRPAAIKILIMQATDEKMDYDEEIEALEAVFEEPQEGDEN